MLLNMTLTLLTTMTITFMFAKHPLAMILILVAQTLAISIITFFLFQFPWLSYTLILVFLGGMLVMFSYMANIASNEMFKVHPQIILHMTMLMMLSLNFNPPSTEMITSKMTNNISMTSKSLIIMKPYSHFITPLTILMATYIILTLLTIVKVSKMNQGPIRLK